METRSGGTDPDPFTHAGPLVGALARAIVSAPRRFALFLDLDGTLLDIAAKPDAVTVPDHLATALDAVRTTLGGSLAIVSGRTLDEVDRLLAPVALSGAGVHGAELRAHGVGDHIRLAPPIDADLREEILRLVQDGDGLSAEIKGAGMAVHYREHPRAASRLTSQLETLLADLGRGRYDLRPGRCVLEILPRGLSKGTALLALGSTDPFLGRIPIMIGDDLGDVPAFRAAEALHGYALRVAGETYPAHAADFAGPSSVRAWLHALARESRSARSLGERGS